MVKMSPNHQMIIKHVCEANDLNSYVSMNFNQIKPMNELKRKGVKFRNLNNKVLKNLKKSLEGGGSGRIKKRSFVC